MGWWHDTPPEHPDVERDNPRRTVTCSDCIAGTAHDLTAHPDPSGGLVSGVLRSLFENTEN